MARIKRGKNKIKNRRKVMKLVKGFRAARRRNYRVANEALLHSLAYSYRDRRVRKRDFRSLWIARINAAARAKRQRSRRRRVSAGAEGRRAAPSGRVLFLRRRSKRNGAVPFRHSPQK